MSSRSKDDADEHHDDADEDEDEDDHDNDADDHDNKVETTRLHRPNIYIPSSQLPINSSSVDNNTNQHHPQRNIIVPSTPPVALPLPPPHLSSSSSSSSSSYAKSPNARSKTARIAVSPISLSSSKHKHNLKATNISTAKLHVIVPMTPTCSLTQVNYLLLLRDIGNYDHPDLRLYNRYEPEIQNQTVHLTWDWAGTVNDDTMAEIVSWVLYNAIPSLDFAQASIYFTFG